MDSECLVTDSNRRLNFKVLSELFKAIDDVTAHDDHANDVPIGGL